MRLHVGDRHSPFESVEVETDWRNWQVKKGNGKFGITNSNYQLPIYFTKNLHNSSLHLLYKMAIVRLKTDLQK